MGSRRTTFFAASTSVHARSRPATTLRPQSAWARPERRSRPPTRPARAISAGSVRRPCWRGNGGGPWRRVRNLAMRSASPRRPAFIVRPTSATWPVKTHGRAPSRTSRRYWQTRRATQPAAETRSLVMNVALRAWRRPLDQAGVGHHAHEAITDVTGEVGRLGPGAGHVRRHRFVRQGANPRTLDRVIVLRRAGTAVTMAGADRPVPRRGCGTQVQPGTWSMVDLPAQVGSTAAASRPSRPVAPPAAPRPRTCPQRFAVTRGDVGMTSTSR